MVAGICGADRDRVRKLTFEFTDMLDDVWAEEGPPAHIGMAIQIGWKPRKRRGEPLEEAVISAGDLEWLLNAYPG